MAVPSFVRVACAASVTAIIVAFTGAPGQARVPRGGPRDWSHSHLAASRFGPDGDQNISKDYRTHMKHVRLDRARAARNPMADWLAEFFRRPRKQETPTTKPPHLDWNLLTGGPGSVLGYPAKYSFDISASHCSDVIYFTVTHAGLATRPNLIAITQPYVGCLPENPTGATPKVKFAIGMTAGTATSPVPSLDGKVLYAIESRVGAMVLHAVNVDNVTTNPGTYNYVTTSWSGARALAAPTPLPTSEQLFEITLAGVTNNASSPYLDYGANQIFFGDSTGYVHRIVNVHTAAASRDTTSFPVRCGTAELQSPVYWQGQVIVTSADGRLYRIDTRVPPPYTCVASALAGVGNDVGGGLAAPIVDVTNNKVIVTTNHSSNGNRGIGAFNLTFAAGAVPTSHTFTGPTSPGIPPVTPAFDDAFWSTNNGAVYTAGASNGPARTYLTRVLYNGEIGVVAGNVLLANTGNGIVPTSPVTEFLTSAPTTPDYLFIGGGDAPYTFMNRVNSGFTTAQPPTSVGSFATAQGVRSGIIVDTRTTSMTGATATANIYFGSYGVTGTSRIYQLAQGF